MLDSKGILRFYDFGGIWIPRFWKVLESLWILGGFQEEFLDILES